MARYQLIIAYDGTCFAGSQRQAKLRTVQSVLELALQKTGWQGRSLLLSGRTDTGVHASGQVAALDLDWVHGSEALQKALNARLPADIVVCAVKEVSARFHPRFDALWRSYRYQIYCQPLRDPLRDRYAWRVWPPMQGDLLQSAARLLPGENDFAAFGSPPRAGGSTVRTVLQSEWRQTDDMWVFTVKANAFLYRMVRRMVYVQVAVGLGRIELDSMQAALDGTDGLPAGLAPPTGLSLVEVQYSFDDVLVSKK